MGLVNHIVISIKWDETENKKGCQLHFRNTGYFSLGLSREELRPLIFFPFCAVLSFMGAIDAAREYKSKEVWSAEKQLKTWITGKSSYTFFKAFFVVLFTLAWLVALTVFITTGHLSMSWEAVYK